MKRAGFAGLGLFAFVLAAAAAVPAPNGHAPFVQTVTPELPRLLLAPGAWRPYPTRAAPAGFDAIPAELRAAFIREAAEQAGGPWPAISATAFLEFVRSGNRGPFQEPFTERRRRLTLLVLAEVFERQGRFLDSIVDGVWAIAEESGWELPAHIHQQKAGPGLPDVADPLVDISSSETAALLAWTSYLLGGEFNKINRLITRRIALEIDRRIFAPFLAAEDWPWLGYRWLRQKPGANERRPNNHNPWTNKNVLTCALLLERDPTRRIALVAKVLETLDHFLLPHPADGGCDEGPNYWMHAAACAFEALETLHSASDGRIDRFGDPLIKAMGRYIVGMDIAFPYFANFADSPARLTTLDGPLLFRYGKAIRDPALAQLGAHIARATVRFDRVSIDSNLGRLLPSLLALPRALAAEAAEPLPRDAWFPDIQVMAARARAGTPRGFYLAAQGGHNAESHNHNDVGNFIVYHDGTPVLIDAGNETYTAQTFSNRRYQLWFTQSAWHNLPTINGAMQKDGLAYAARDVAYRSDDNETRFTLDLAGAYPAAAMVRTWVRSLVLRRATGVEIHERYELERCIAPLELNFLTPRVVEPAGEGSLRLAADGTVPILLRFDPARFTAKVETRPLTDALMRQNWGGQLHRIALTARTAATADAFSVTVSAPSSP